MKMFRSHKNFVLFGLCGGIAEALGIKALWIRLAAAAASLLTGGFAILVYLALSILIPKRSDPRAAEWAEAWELEPEPLSAGGSDEKSIVSLKKEMDALQAKLSRYERTIRLQAETGLGR